MKKGTLLTICFLLFISYLAFSLIWTGNKYECEICVKYKGVEECQNIKGMDKNDTIMAGVSTACGALANGMTESIECQNTKPTKLQCRNL